MDAKLKSEYAERYRLEVEIQGQRVIQSGQPLESGGVTQQVWERRRCLGRGAFGEVWQEHLQDEYGDSQYRAVKICRTTSATQRRVDFRRELSALAAFSESKYAGLFVNLRGWWLCSGDLYVATEYLKYGDLSRYIGIGLPESAARDITRNILQGLKVMHREGFTHRDLKPQNILVVEKQPECPRWWVKIADFGLSKQVLQDSTDGNHSRIGTLGYCAPETLEDCVKSSHFDRIDMWSLGCTLFNIASRGRLPFTPAGLLRHYDGTLPFNPQSVALQLDINGYALVEALLQARPELRPNAAEALGYAWIVSGALSVNSGTSSEVQNKTSTNFDRNYNSFLDSILSTDDYGDVSSSLVSSAKGSWQDLRGGDDSARQESNEIDKISQTSSPQILDTKSSADQLSYIKHPSITDEGTQNELVSQRSSLVRSVKPEPIENDQDAPSKDIFKSFRVALEDPCYKFLPAALLKYGIQADWRQYMLYIVYENQERCVDLEEKPLALFKDLDREGKKPMFMLRKLASQDEQSVKTASELDKRTYFTNTDPNEKRDSTDENKLQNTRTLPYNRVRVKAVDMISNAAATGAIDEPVTSMAQEYLPDDAETFSRPLVPVIISDLADKPNVLDREQQSEYITMHQAARDGRIEDVERLIRAEWSVAQPDHNDQSPLHWAAENGHLNVVICLLDAGADVGQVTKSGRMALHHAADNGHLRITKLLVESGSSINWEDARSQTPLHLAIYGGHIETIIWLSQHGARLDVESNICETLMRHAVERNCLSVVVWLYKKGVDIHRKKGEVGDQEYLLRTAVRMGHIETLEWLFNHDVKWSDKCYGKQTILSSIEAQSHIWGRKPVVEWAQQNISISTKPPWHKRMADRIL